MRDEILPTICVHICRVAYVSFHCSSGRAAHRSALSVLPVAPSPTLPFWIALPGANGSKGGLLVEAVVIFTPTWCEVAQANFRAITQAAFLACLAGTFANSTVSPSAGVGCVKIAFLRAVNGRPPSIAV